MDKGKLGCCCEMRLVFYIHKDCNRSRAILRYFLNAGSRPDISFKDKDVRYRRCSLRVRVVVNSLLII